jgi:hypothetical protein
LPIEVKGWQADADGVSPNWSFVMSDSDLIEAEVDECALSATSDLVVLELSDDELMVGSKAAGLETIRVVGYFESLAVRLKKHSAARSQ